jgi:hypothetical protein
MSDDPQSHAESFDEAVTGLHDPVSSDEAQTDFPPEEPVGLPFADADVTDESYADRDEVPEVWERSRQPDLTRSEMAADEELTTMIEVQHLDD